MRICVRVTAARTHSWMARYGSSDTAVTPSIPSSRVKPIALVDARNRNRPSEAPKSARILPSHTASIAYYVSEERHSKSWVRSGMSENVRSHIGRIHHSLRWYKDRTQSSCGTSTSKQTSTAQNGLYVSCS